MVVGVGFFIELYADVVAPFKKGHDLEFETIRIASSHDDDFLGSRNDGDDCDPAMS